MAGASYHLMDHAADHTASGTLNAASKSMANSVEAILEYQGGADPRLLAAAF